MCQEWTRKSFQNFPRELLLYSTPKSKPVAEAGATALIAFLKNYEPKPTRKCNIRVGDWLQKFTSVTESPKAARLNAKNRPYSMGSVGRLKGLYEVHMKDDPFMNLLMAEAESHDALAFLKQKPLGLSSGFFVPFSTKIKRL